MPYITVNRKKEIDVGSLAKTSGELNYSITRLLLKYLKNSGESYQTYNDIIGALECAKEEIYRRKISSYEDVKLKENGDVFND